MVGFFSSAVSGEEHAVLRHSPLGGVKLLNMEIAERGVDSVLFNAVGTKRQLWWCLILGSVFSKCHLNVECSFKE